MNDELSNEDVAKLLAGLTRDMEEARAQRNAKVKKIYHQTNLGAWEKLKKVLGYEEPAWD